LSENLGSVVISRGEGMGAAALFSTIVTRRILLGIQPRWVECSLTEGERVMKYRPGNRLYHHG